LIFSFSPAVYLASFTLAPSPGLCTFHAQTLQFMSTIGFWSFRDPFQRLIPFHLTELPAACISSCIRLGENYCCPFFRDSISESLFRSPFPPFLPPLSHGRPSAFDAHVTSCVPDCRLFPLVPTPQFRPAPPFPENYSPFTFLSSASRPFDHELASRSTPFRIRASS